MLLATPGFLDHHASAHVVSRRPVVRRKVAIWMMVAKFAAVSAVVDSIPAAVTLEAIFVFHTMSIPRPVVAAAEPLTTYPRASGTVPVFTAAGGTSAFPAVDIAQVPVMAWCVVSFRYAS